MSESNISEELSNVDATSTDEQPRKYLRRNNVRSLILNIFLRSKIISI